MPVIIWPKTHPHSLWVVAIHFVLLTLVRPESLSALSPQVKPSVIWELVQIPGGEFNMGSNEHDSEKPVRRVRVSEFQMYKSEVTQDHWVSVMGNNPSNFKGCADCPVENVSWDEVQKFIRKESAQTGWYLRLPTEAEWEYAAGGGASHQKYAGTSNADELGEYAWYDVNAGGKTHAVCQKRPNQFGLCDMSGNVSEWVTDGYGSYAGGGTDNPAGSTTGSRRVDRGGSWISGADFVRVASRPLIDPDHRYENIGFRLVRQLGPETPAQRDARLEVECKAREEADRWEREMKAVEETAAWTASQREKEAQARHTMEKARLALGVEFVWIPGGGIDMGSDEGRAEEKPVHRVRVSAFAIGKSEVTQAQWVAVMGVNRSHFAGCDDCPVENVTWNALQEFIRKASAQTGLSLRLPTEAEWEFAAGGGAPHQKWAGTNNESELEKYAWYKPNSGGKPHAVCQKRPNQFGLCDMSGNVGEWVSDWYGDYESDSRKDPTGPAAGTSRVIRGGFWFGDAGNLRVANREDFDPGGPRSFLGFRLVLNQ